MLKMKCFFLFFAGLFCFAGAADTRLFSGADAGDNLFSNTNNWNVFPVTGETIIISSDGTSSDNPAVIDAAFSVEVGSAKLYSGTPTDGASGGSGMSYAEVADGGILKATSIYVGNSGNHFFDGSFTLKSGGTVLNRYPVSGLFEVGGDLDTEIGVVTIEDEASLTHVLLKLNPYGCLTFEFGEASVTPFVATDTAEASVLDGLLQVDFSELTESGTYTLLDTEFPIVGALMADLAAAGGAITNESQSTHFNVLNGDDVEWELMTADGSNDLVVAVNVSSSGDVLFSDSFDRIDSADVNLGSASNQEGIFAPLTYDVFANNTPNVSAVSSNELLLSVDGSGNIRAVPQVDLSDQGAAIAAAGGFEIAYRVNAGVDFTNVYHSAYFTSLILGQEGIVENAGTGSANAYYGLFVTIFGNGAVRAYSQGTNLLDVVNADYGNAYLTGQPNAVRLIVETDGILTSCSNRFTLYINDVEVGSSNFFWKTSNDLSLALEAANYSARFDHLDPSVDPTNTSSGVPYAWLDTFYTNLVSDADYESAAGIDTDGDGFSGRDEYRVGTDPTDSDSLFAIKRTAVVSSGNVVAWSSAESGLYSILSSESLVSPDWVVIASNVVGQANETSYTVTPARVTGFVKVVLQ